MHATATLIAAAIALLSVQMVPAPEAAIPVIGAVTGVASLVNGIEGNKGNKAKRDTNGLVSVLNGAKSVSGQIAAVKVASKRQATGYGTAEADCKKQLQGANLRFSQPVHTTIHVEGIPPACMTIMAVVNGKIHSGNPVPMGSDSIQFVNLSDSDLKKVEDALNISQSN